MPSIDNLELLEARISKLESLVGHFDKLDQTKVLFFVENFFFFCNLNKQNSIQKGSGYYNGRF